MKFPAKSIAWLLPLLLMGCIHKTHQSQVQPPLAPPIEDTPAPKPDNAPANLPQPVISVPAPAPAPAPTPTATVEPPKPPPKHKKPVAKTNPPTTARITSPATQDAPQQQASNTMPGVPAAGQLTSGEPADLRQQTANSIAATEKSLSAITRVLSEQEQKTSTQIREFLKQAKTALGSGDLDGANTLVVKAKVLLGELSQ